MDIYGAFLTRTPIHFHVKAVREKTKQKKEKKKRRKYPRRKTKLKIC